MDVRGVSDTVADNLRREWWRITKRGQQTMVVYFCPEASRLEVMARYPGSQIEAITPKGYAEAGNQANEGER